MVARHQALVCTFWLSVRLPTLAEKFYCQSSGSPVYMIKLTETREITPYLWVHPGEER